jgi:hypothetical protein
MNNLDNIFFDIFIIKDKDDSIIFKRITTGFKIFG